MIYKRAVWTTSILTAFFVTAVSGKIRSLKPSIPLRPVAIKNLAYSPTGNYFSVPNFVTAGSVGVFAVSESGQIASVPSRYSEKNFSRISGVYYLIGREQDDPEMVFVPLPELLSGYSVSFAPHGDTLAIAGGDNIYIYATDTWKNIRTITISQNTTRCVFSPNGSLLAAVSDGKVYVLDRQTGSVLYTIKPEKNHKFTDLAFTENSEKVAVYEYQDLTMDYGSRVKIFTTADGSFDRQFPYFKDKPASPPGKHFPLISYSSKDTAIAVNIEKPVFGKVLLIKSNDGDLIREFKGNFHSFSDNKTFFVTGNRIYSSDTWKSLGKISSSALCAAFSPTERVLIVVTPESLKRYKID